MASENDKQLEQRVIAAAEDALAKRNVVTAIDVLGGLGWLPASREQAWRQGRVHCLEAAVDANPNKISKAMRFLDHWAHRRGLKPSETAYARRGPGRQALRFSMSGHPDIERAYRTHWVSPDLSERARERLAERQSRPPDLVVVQPLNEWSCTACDGSGDLLIMDEPGPLCLTCAELDHLVFLAAGDAALTRRAKAASRLSAVVVRFSRARKRYERQGILVEEDALAAAEQRCLADADVRARRRERDSQRRATEDEAQQARFARQIADMFPGCPAARARAIARRAAAPGSGRVGRSAVARDRPERAVELAVLASIRHEDTDYDDLLMAGVDRHDARERVRNDVDQILRRWQPR
jgi:hypothetical protein